MSSKTPDGSAPRRVLNDGPAPTPEPTPPEHALPPVAPAPISSPSAYGVFPDAGSHASPQRVEPTPAVEHTAPQRVASDPTPSSQDPSAQRVARDEPAPAPEPAQRVADQPSAAEDSAQKRARVNADQGTPQRAATQDPHGNNGNRTSFGASVAWTLASAIVPPVGLIRAGRKVLGWCLIGVAVGLVAGLVFVGASDPSGLVTQLASHVTVRNLAIAGGLIAAGALVWVAIIAYTHLKTRPSKLRVAQRIVGSVLVSALAFAVAAPAAVAVRYTYDTASLLDTVFTDGGKSATRSSTEPDAEDPFGGRLNVLLLGGDDAASRDASLGARTDTVIVASINTETGDTVLLSLPRNTAKMPFPEDSPLHEYYPNGFYDGIDPDNAEYMLNAMYHNVPAQAGQDILGETDNIGADVLKISTGEALGLDIHYYVQINLDGFRDLIDALGGITVNVNYRIPRGGSTDTGTPPKSYIEPGPDQHLDGADALWYARGRYGLDDFSRMERQRCVISAVAEQADPVNILARYEAVTKAGKEIIRTDVPSDLLPSLLNVATVVQEADNMQSIVFKHGYSGFSSRYPDWDLVRTQVETTIDSSASNDEDSASPSPSATTTSATPTTSSTSPSSTPTSSNSSTSSTDEPAENTKDACAYNPQ